MEGTVICASRADGFAALAGSSAVVAASGLGGMAREWTTAGAAGFVLSTTFADVAGAAGLAAVALGLLVAVAWVAGEAALGDGTGFLVEGFVTVAAAFLSVATAFFAAGWGAGLAAALGAVFAGADAFTFLGTGFATAFLAGALTGGFADALTVAFDEDFAADFAAGLAAAFLTAVTAALVLVAAFVLAAGFAALDEAFTSCLLASTAPAWEASSADVPLGDALTLSWLRVIP